MTASSLLACKVSRSRRFGAYRTYSASRKDSCLLRLNAALVVSRCCHSGSLIKIAIAIRDGLPDLGGRRAVKISHDRKIQGHATARSWGQDTISSSTLHSPVLMQPVQLSGEMESLCRRVDELLLIKGATEPSSSSSLIEEEGGSSCPATSYDESESLSSYGGASSIFSRSSSLASPTPSTSGSSSPALEACDARVPVLAEAAVTSPEPTLDGKSKQRYAASLVRREAQALFELAQRLEQEGETEQDTFAAAVDALQSMKKYGKVLFSGVGKSGLLARKAVATFNSLGKLVDARRAASLAEIHSLRHSERVSSPCRGSPWRRRPTFTLRARYSHSRVLLWPHQGAAPTHSAPTTQRYSQHHLAYDTTVTPRPCLGHHAGRDTRER